MNIHDRINFRSALALFMTDDYEIAIKTDASEIIVMMRWDKPDAILMRWENSTPRVTTLPRADVRGVLLRTIYAESVKTVQIKYAFSRDVRRVYPYDRYARLESHNDWVTQQAH